MNTNSKAELLDELIVECEGKLQSLQEEAALEERYLRDLKAKRAGLRHSENDEKAGANNNSEVSGALTLPEAIKAVLTNAGKSLRAKDISEALEKAGYGKGAKNGLGPSVLSALGRREDLFRKVRRGVYRLKTDRPEL